MNSEIIVGAVLLLIAIIFDLHSNSFIYLFDRTYLHMCLFVFYFFLITSFQKLNMNKKEKGV